jgi:hypothetical protein
VVLWTLYLVTRIQVINKIAAEPTMDPMEVGHPGVFIAFSRNIDDLIRANEYLSVLSLLVYLKLLKYLNIFSWFRMLNEVIQDCLGRLVRFAILIVVIFFGFGVSLFVGLGSTDKRYAVMQRSFISLFFMFVEGITIDANWFEANNGSSGYIGPMLSLSYLIVVYFILSNIFMAIVLEAYVSAGICRDARRTGSDLTKRNPMSLFLFTYYHKVRKLSLLPDDEALPEEQSIKLVDLPGIVTRKWMEKKCRMQLLVDKTLGEVSEEEMSRRMTLRGNLASGDRSPKVKTWGETATKLRKMIQISMSLPLAEEFEVPEPQQSGTRTRLYGDSNPGEESVSLAQLQALLDQEPTLQILLGTRSAIDVIRYFKFLQGEAPTEEGAQQNDPLEKIARLQDGAFKKVEYMEKKGLNIDRRPVPHVDDLAQVISDELTTVQNGWREELTKLIEQMTNIADAMKETQLNVNKVVQNNEEFSRLLGDGSSESTSEVSSSEESSESEKASKNAPRGSMFGNMGPKASKRGSVGGR